MDNKVIRPLILFDRKLIEATQDFNCLRTYIAVTFILIRLTIGFR